jgi:hypothetical protein
MRRMNDRLSEAVETNRMSLNIASEIFALTATAIRVVMSLRSLITQLNRMHPRYSRTS